jgi:hypothetical protein
VSDKVKQPKGIVFDCNEEGGHNDHRVEQPKGIVFDCDDGGDEDTDGQDEKLKHILVDCDGSDYNSVDHGDDISEPVAAPSSQEIPRYHPSHKERVKRDDDQSANQDTPDKEFSDAEISDSFLAAAELELAADIPQPEAAAKDNCPSKRQVDDVD